VVELHGFTPAELKRISSPGWKLSDWQSLLSVFVDQGSATPVPMLGSYRVDGGTIVFEPQFPLQRGITYRATVKPAILRKTPGGSPSITAAYRVNDVEPPSPTEVSSIYPTSDVVPENLLKFYVHFSSPMSRGSVYDRITLRHSSGRVVELPFLEIGEELWDRDMRRLTLLFDPGRIKRGVRPLGEVGASLVAGEAYSLVIGRDLVDAGGNRLKSDFVKTFHVGASERDPIDVQLWRIIPPAKGSRDSLRIEFPKPMDSALALRFIVVANTEGAPLRGQSILSDEERVLSFRPEDSWTSSEYVLLVQPILEDLAGNNVGKPFDVDLFEGIQKRITTDPIKIPFRIQ
jgi:hypothetical protein